MKFGGKSTESERDREEIKVRQKRRSVRRWWCWTHGSIILSRRTYMRRASTPRFPSPSEEALKKEEHQRPAVRAMQMPSRNRVCPRVYEKHVGGERTGSVRMAMLKSQPGRIATRRDAEVQVEVMYIR